MVNFISPHFYPVFKRVTNRKLIMRRLFYTFLVACILPFSVFSQQEKCFSSQLMAENLQRWPGLAQQRALLEQEMKAYEATHGAKPKERMVLTIPVVVHVVYKNSYDNISLAQIQSQIDVLNTDFRKQNEEIGNIPVLFSGLAADLEFQFCLVQFDPQGNSTSGVTRQQTFLSNIALMVAPDGRRRLHYNDLGGTNTWNPNKYLNIWVARIGSGILGFATPPGTAPAAEDGVVVDPVYFGTVGIAEFNTPNNLGRTATHEVGHYFNLFHIWGNGFNSCNDDDEVADTPKQRDPYNGCPNHPQSSCGITSMFMNYMDYTDDGCMFMFTHGQKSRMTAALYSARPDLLTNGSCIYVSTGEPDEAAAPNVYPNPATEVINVVWSSVPGQVSASITDMQGKTWLMDLSPLNNNAETLTYEVSALPAGVYCLHLDDGKARYSLKFVKM